MRSKIILPGPSQATTGHDAESLAPPAGEKLVPLSDALAALPITLHPATGVRWITAGVNGRRLEAQRIGARWFTSIEAVRRFASVS